MDRGSMDGTSRLLGERSPELSRKVLGGEDEKWKWARRNGGLKSIWRNEGGAGALLSSSEKRPGSEKGPGEVAGLLRW
jgi:hypothetical protein